MEATYSADRKRLEITWIKKERKGKEEEKKKTPNKQENVPVTVSICKNTTHLVFSSLTQPSQLHSIPLCASLCLVLNADSETVEMKEGLSRGLRSQTLVGMTG